jgi:hypothetical protein
MRIVIPAPPPGERLSRKDLRGALHHVSLTLKTHFALHPYEIQQSLEALGSFWAAVSNKSKRLKDYRLVFEESPPEVKIDG